MRPRQVTVGGRQRRERAAGPPPFYRLVYRVVRRAVGMALGALRGPLLDLVPWQRVINAAGRCSHRDGFWADIQREFLEREGVRFDRRGRVDLKRTRWPGPRREWVTRLRHEL